MKPGQLTKTLKNMAHFYGWGSTASRLQSHFEEAVCFLPLSCQKFQNITSETFFLKNHIYTRCGGETIPRPFSKKWTDLWIEILKFYIFFFIVCQVEDYRNWLKLSCRPLAVNLSHIQLFSNTKRGLGQAVFSTWTKNQDKNINILGTKRAFNMK